METKYFRVLLKFYKKKKEKKTLKVKVYCSGEKSFIIS